MNEYITSNNSNIIKMYTITINCSIINNSYSVAVNPAEQMTK